MNTRLGKSFGLVFVVAVGILAVMFALGTFNAPKAGADVNDGASVTKSVETSPEAPGPGAGIGMTLKFQLDGPAAVFDEITISLEDFGVPATIAERLISVRVGDDAGAAAAVDVSGDNIVVELPDLNGDPQGLGIAANTDISIVIRKNAGITVPSTAGDYPVTVAHNDTDAVELGKVVIVAAVSVDPEKGGSGTMITVSGKAFANGTGSLFSRAVSVGPDGDIGTDAADAAATRNQLMSINVSGGSFSVEVDAKDLNTGDQGHSQFEVMDADGPTDATATFQLTGTTTISPESVDKGKVIEISLSDWIQATPDGVKIGGVDVVITDEDGEAEDGDGNAISVGTPDEDGALTFYVKVGGNVGLGTKTLVLLANEIRLDSASVEITSLPLSVVPTTAVAGEEITVEGPGFAGNAVVKKISVGGVIQDELSNGNNIADENTRATSSGRVVVTFMVPDGVTDGTRTIQVTDEKGRIGEVDLTVPEPAITLDPDTSRRGTTVVVTGSGFPANESIDILYNGEQEDSARSDSTGNWASTLPIPNDATIGGTVDVEGRVVVDDETYSAKVKHTVPGEEMTLSPEMARGGDTVTITGTGFPAYRPVTVRVGILAEISTGANTDGNGDFSTSILLPALNVGTHLVQVRAGENSATKVLTVPDREAMPVTRPSADVFEPLVTAGVLTVVWYFDNDTKAWSFYDPRPEVAAAVDLTMVSSGDNVWIQVMANMDFQGEMLTAGWNLVTLN